MTVRRRLGIVVEDRSTKIHGTLSSIRFFPIQALLFRAVTSPLWHRSGLSTPPLTSPFLNCPSSEWLASNELAFAIPDGFAISPGHTLVIPKRIVCTWFDASVEEQHALMALVGEVKLILDSLIPAPEGYNVGFNAGEAAGQTVPHLHVHIIPRYQGDVPDPRGGIRHVIPSKANYLLPPTPEAPRGPTNFELSTGHPHDPLWTRLAPRLSGATEIDVLASFAQMSGLDIIEAALFDALREGARVRILVGDYLHITDPLALRRLLGWMQAALENPEGSSLTVGLVEIARLPGAPASFHPKAWRVADQTGGVFVVGSSNLSRPALLSGVEWNLIGDTNAALHGQVKIAFADLWATATPLTEEVVERYLAAAKLARLLHVEPESLDILQPLPEPRPWQILALEKLADIRMRGYGRALVAVATGLGKTWLAAFDLLGFGRALGRRPRVLALAHRAEILVQMEGVFRYALDSEWPGTEVTWCLKSHADLSGHLVIASVQKLSRPEGLAALGAQSFDYVIIDEVHHAEAPTYRKLIARLHASFLLGLTATPERADGVDVASLFDDILAWQATIGDGIAEGSLVPFHYVGIKDAIDFKQIPWRNGRFDPGVLELKVEASARMEKLWTAWQAHPATRTVVFCCSRRHALFTRDWLLARGIRAAAIFSGTGGDSRGESIARLVDGHLDALCVVDLFNEGINLPGIDRVIMLRPTDSKVVFVQQLGRGLRATEGKSRLVVIDFVGNHRVFAQRIVHLLSLHGTPGNWTKLRQILDGAPPELPPGCLLDIELEARDLLRSLLPSGGTAVEEAYRAARDELGRRPTMTELFHRGYLPGTLAAKHDHWFAFVRSENDLGPEEITVLNQFQAWFKMLGTTALNFSFKMVVLRTLLDWDAFWNGMPLPDLAQSCRAFLLGHPQLKVDLKPSKEIPNHVAAADAIWAKWWRAWPVDKWLSAQAGHTWFKLDADQLRFAPDCPPPLRPVFEAMTAELVDYRLAHYTASRHLSGTTATAAGDGQFSAKVSHSGGNPILFLPNRTQFPGLPSGPVDIQLPNGQSWTFRFVKVACNVAHLQGETTNRLPELLRQWFGADAGLPGTGFTVEFTQTETGWSAAPVPIVVRKTPPALAPAELILVDSPPEKERFLHYVPVYSLEAAAGGWGPESSPTETGWLRVNGIPLSQGMFVARVDGQSMEPKIPSGSWCLFRPCPAGTREGRIVLIQFQTMADPEDGGRYTVKKYHSIKTQTAEGWEHAAIELRPLNPDYKLINVQPGEAAEMLIAGAFVAVVG